ncbi:hypothetical protein NQ318_012502, partial [Aromia moschata]
REGGGPQGGAGPAGATVTVTATGCRLRGTSASNASLATSPNSRGSAPVPTPPQNGPQSGPQGAPLRSNPGAKANDENGPTRNSNSSDVMVNCETDPPPSLEEIRSWGRSFDKLMRSAAGRKIFRDFLRGEYSEENILFWLACEELKKETNPEVVEEKARIIYEDYISILSPKEVSLDSRVREIVNRNMVEPTPNTFDDAQLQIYTLMHRDSYPRFVNSLLYRSLSQQSTGTSGPQPAMTTAMVTVSSG